MIVYAGAAQFLSVGLLGAKMGLAGIFMTVLFLNLRHAFYGFSMFKRFPERSWRLWYSIFGLTDETYSVLTAKTLEDKVEDQRFCLLVSALHQAYWVAGCALGGLLGMGLRFETKGFEFVLTALFVVLTVEQALAVRDPFPFLVAAASGAAALALWPAQMLPISMGLAFTALLVKSLRGARHG